MSDQQNFETNQEKEGMSEEYVQPPIVEQEQQKSVPTSVTLSLAFYLALGYLGILLLIAIAAGAWGLLFLAVIWLHILCFIIATILLWNGKKNGNKTILYAATIFYFFSVIAANDPYWRFNLFTSLLMAGMVFIGTLLLPDE